MASLGNRKIKGHRCFLHKYHFPRMQNVWHLYLKKESIGCLDLFQQELTTMSLTGLPMLPRQTKHFSFSCRSPSSEMTSVLPHAQLSEFLSASPMLGLLLPGNKQKSPRHRTVLQPSLHQHPNKLQHDHFLHLLRNITRIVVQFFQLARTRHILLSP